jgi:hypothetical protein
MAARTGVPIFAQQEKTRAAIQTTQLIKRLQHFALGEEEPHDPAKSPPKELDQARLKAIEILLRKALPDLSSVTLGGDADNPVTVTFRTIYETK